MVHFPLAHGFDDSFTKWIKVISDSKRERAHVDGSEATNMKVCRLGILDAVNATKCGLE